MTVNARTLATSTDAFAYMQQKGGTLPARRLPRKAGYLVEHVQVVRLLGYLPVEGELAEDGITVTIPLARFSLVTAGVKGLQATGLPKQHLALLAQAAKRVRS